MNKKVRIIGHYLFFLFLFLPAHISLLLFPSSPHPQSPNPHKSSDDSDCWRGFRETMGGGSMTVCVIGFIIGIAAERLRSGSSVGLGGRRW